LFTLGELTEKFSLDRCAKNAAIFDLKKLEWMNGEYLRKIEPSKLADVFFRWAEATGNSDKIKHWDRELAKKVIEMEHEKFKLLTEVPDLIDFFFRDGVEYMPEAVEKTLKAESAKMVLTESSVRLGGLARFEASALEKFARDLSVEKGIKAGQVFHPLRAAISGRTTGPSLFHMMEIFGKDKVLQRINGCLERFFK
jgi:nondiscriminating glutamyl-tRNA synthetase